MNKLTKRFLGIFAGIICLVMATSWQVAQIASPVLANLGTPESVTGDRPIEPIPAAPILDTALVALGDKLYRDPQLSKNDRVACISCHLLDKGGSDRRAQSIGIDGQIGSINAPTILNSSLHFKQFWDGRAETLEEQIEGPIHGAKEMGSNWEQIIAKLQKSPEYVAQFGKLYPDGITSNNIKNAIATFERSLVTPDSRFDLFLKGDSTAINAEEQEGYRRFQASGCISCHQGVLLGGNLYQKFGVFGDYFKDRGNITEVDNGRFNVTKNEVDRYSFKVPSLRNVELTSPYFHDGSAQTLEQAIKVMFKYQIGREPSIDDTKYIIKFLTTLSSPLKGVS
jgi:cytochrome c peroxidase